MKIKKTAFAFLLSSAMFFASASFAAAVGVGVHQAADQAGLSFECPAGLANCDKFEESEEAEEKFSTEGAKNYFLELVGRILQFIAIIAVLMLIIGGVRLVIARGDSDALGEAKKHFVHTLAGLFVVIFSLIIVQNITEIVYEVAPIGEEKPKELWICDGMQKTDTGIWICE